MPNLTCAQKAQIMIAYAQGRFKGATPLPGEEHLVAVTKRGTPVAVVAQGKRGEFGVLTVESHCAIVHRARELGFKGPVHIIGFVNAGPNGSLSYTFEVMPEWLFPQPKARREMPEIPHVEESLAA